MKKVLNFTTLIILSTFINDSCGQAKVRVAAHAIVQVGQTAFNSIKANKFRTTMLASTLAFAGYAKYRHGWYDRELTRLEGLQKQRQTYKHKTVQSSLCNNENHGHCPPEIANLINDYAGADEKDLKIEAQIKRIKAAAATTKEITLKNYLIGLRSGRFTQNEKAEILESICAAIPLLGPMWFVEAHCLVPLSFITERLTGLQISTFTLHNWTDVKNLLKDHTSFFLKWTKITAGPCYLLVAGILLKSWLDERKRQAERAAWIADHTEN